MEHKLEKNLENNIFSVYSMSSISGFNISYIITAFKIK